MKYEIQTKDSLPCRASPCSKSIGACSVKGSINPPSCKPVNCGRSKQVLIGKRVVNRKIKMRLLVCCELWPSTALELTPWSEEGVIVFSVGSNEEERKLISETVGNIYWISSFEDFVDEMRDGLIIFQGTQEFIQSQLLQIPGLGNYEGRIMVIMPSVRLRGGSIFHKLKLSWKRIRHGAIGGVTLDCWSLGLPRKLKNIMVTDIVQYARGASLDRRFEDVIKSSTGGKVYKALGGEVIELPSRVQTKDIEKTLFILPSVFSSTGWVTRQLTSHELGGLFDVSELLAKKIEKAKLSRCPYSQSLPGKYAQLVAEVLLHEFGVEKSQRVDVESKIQIVRPKGTNDSSIIQLPSAQLPCGQSQKVCKGKVLKRSYDESEQQISTKATSRKITKCEKSLADQCCLDSNPTVSSSSTISLLQTPTVTGENDEAGSYLKSYGEHAAKDDDAEVPIQLWNGFLFHHFLPTTTYVHDIHGKALDVIRDGALVGVRRRTYLSFRTYLVTTYGKNWSYLLNAARAGKIARKRKLFGPNLCEKVLASLLKDVEVGTEAIGRICNCSWWNWSTGSTLLFWRWPADIRMQARDGVTVFIQGKLPYYRKKQRIDDTPGMAEKMVKKLQKVIERGYVSDAYIRSLINCFAVAKGIQDIRLVYDGTKSELNAAVWAPNFFLGSIESLLMFTNLQTWLADMDLGEMFLNYYMDPRIRPYSGVDVTSIFQSKKKLWKRWERTFMGFRSSPYNAGKLFGWTIDLIHGNRLDEANPYRWNKVQLNLPGSASYNPVEPRCCKYYNSTLASELEAYVDDIRVGGEGELICKRAVSRAARITQYLGQQDAPRKFRPPHQTPGPWCGTFVSISNDAIWVYVSEEKWKKAGTMVASLLSAFDSPTSRPLVNHKTLEKHRGFLVYFTRTYTFLIPFLKGIHLTLDSWRDGRTPSGWKLKFNKSSPTVHEVEPLDDLHTACEAADFTLVKNEDGDYTAESESFEDAPDSVQVVPRLYQDLLVLQSFLSAASPPWRFTRGRRMVSVRYGFGDAARSGFGASFQKDSGDIWYRMGVWGSDEEAESSNFRELSNLVEALESLAAELPGLIVYLFTDNSTAEAAFYNGTSSNEKLFGLIVRLRQLEMHKGCQLHFVHVAGTRMIAQGTDGLSRGDSAEGVMKGDDMLMHIPLHLSCLDRQPLLREWISSFVTPGKGQSKIEFLSPEGWYERGHDILGGTKNEDKVWTPNYKDGTFIWTPPPAAAQTAVEQLRKARLKRENSTHVVIIPRLMTPEWRKQLFRVSDLFLELPFDDVWTRETQHEPLTIAFIFPFLPFKPWQLKRSPTFLGMGHVLRRMWKEDNSSLRNVLCQFFSQSRKLECLQESMVREMLYSPSRFDVLHTSSRK